MISDAKVGETVSPADVLEVIARAFLDPPASAPRAVAVDGGQRALLAMPAFRPGGISTVKAVSAANGVLNSYLMAFDRRGELLAVVEGHRLTALRTAAASVLAARTLGAGKARRLAVLGAGRQARAHIEAFAEALPLEALTIWARRDDDAHALAAFAAGRVPEARIAASPAEAAAEADIIVCATSSFTPLLCGDMVSHAHIDLVGGFRPDMREADDALMARAAIVADTPAALIEAGDLVQPIARGVIERHRILLLADVLAGDVESPSSDVTVFKSVGHAAEDLVVTELLLGRLGLLPSESRADALQEVPSHA